MSSPYVLDIRDREVLLGISHWFKKVEEEYMRSLEHSGQLTHVDPVKLYCNAARLAVYNALAVGLPFAIAYLAADLEGRVLKFFEGTRIESICKFLFY